MYQSLLLSLRILVALPVCLARGHRWDVLHLATHTPEGEEDYGLLACARCYEQPETYAAREQAPVDIVDRA